MNYKEYIDLGFKRGDLQDNVLFNQTGYYGFYLKFDLTKCVSIEVCSGELDNPKLYIGKDSGLSCHIINITKEQVLQLLSK